MKKLMIKRRALAIVAALVAFARAFFGQFDLRDVFVGAGLTMIGYGLGQIHAPAAFIVVGVALFWLGVRKVAG